MRNSAGFFYLTLWNIFCILCAWELQMQIFFLERTAQTVGGFFYARQRFVVPKITSLAGFFLGGE